MFLLLKLRTSSGVASPNEITVVILPSLAESNNTWQHSSEQNTTVTPECIRTPARFYGVRVSEIGTVLIPNKQHAKSTSSHSTQLFA